MQPLDLQKNAEICEYRKQEGNSFMSCQRVIAKHETKFSY
jgi:hypothetical protein